MLRATKKYRSKLTYSQNVDFAYNVYWQCIALQITFQVKESTRKGKRRFAIYDDRKTSIYHGVYKTIYKK